MKKIVLSLTHEQAEVVAWAIARCNTSLEKKITLERVRMMLEANGIMIEPPLVHVCRQCGRVCRRLECWMCWKERTRFPQPWPYPIHRFPSYVEPEIADKLQRFHELNDRRVEYPNDSLLHDEVLELERLRRWRDKLRIEAGPRG